MKQERTFPKFHITMKGQKSIEANHPWVYEAEVLEHDDFTNGELVDAIGPKGKYLGTGFVSEHSKIRIRIISKNANDVFDDAFYRRRFEYAWNYRKTVLRDEDQLCCRVIFGESDGFPGLTVDRFGNLLVAQVLSIGMDLIKNRIFPILVDVLQKDGQEIIGLYERNDVAIRELEGLQEYKAWFDLSALGMKQPDSPLVDIVENGVKYTVDVENGQKTGFFLDQKFNRQAVARLAKGKTVLDCFTHTGSFALNAAKGGAKKVVAVDVSETATEMAAHNAKINGVDDIMSCVTANVFDLLPELKAKNSKEFDFIILDPPAFTKSRKTTFNALRGYKEINTKAMQLLPRGGYLATCSCSHFATEEKFKAMLAEAAKEANVELKQIEARQQACDHPILWGVEETNYLKFYLFQIV